MFRNKITAFLLVLLSILSFATSVSAISEENMKKLMQMSEQERKFLLMYFDEDELFVVSTTRSLKSIDRIAENVEVVSAADIELMNAHTVADALNTITGVQIRQDGGPGAFAYAHIQGSDFRHVAVFMDGILLNTFSNNLADIAMIPVQLVEKIEVIKGPASSAWGSSLGGVINILTKSGASQKRDGGTLSGSFGEQTALDLRAELYGKKEKTGYYLYAGRMQSDGFRGLPANSGNSFNNYYMKITQDLSKDTVLALTAFYQRGDRGMGYPALDWIDDAKMENLSLSLDLNATLGEGVRLSLSARSAMRDWKFIETIPSMPGYVYDSNSRDNAHGASGKLAWNIGKHALVVGVDYDNGVGHDDDSFKEALRFRTTKWAVYANDTIALGKFSITPGIRYDDDNIAGDFVSPSLGITYDFFEKTLLRASIARGFSSPPVPWASDVIPYGYMGNPDLEPEEVWSYQVGIETGLLKYLWLKTTAFRHDIRDAIVDMPVDDPEGVFTYTSVNSEEIRRQGIEVQFRTQPFHNFMVSGGATYIHTTNETNGETVRDVPESTYDISLKYNDEKSWKALLTGHYIWWNSTRGGKYDSVVVDFNLIKKLYSFNNTEAEAFATAHNIFDGEQHPSSNYFNPDRWIELGIRLKF